MTAKALTTLTTTLKAILDSRREATKAAYQQAVKAVGDNGIRPHAPRSGRPPIFGFTDRVLATILHLRLSLPADTLAHLFAATDPPSAERSARHNNCSSNTAPPSRPHRTRPMR
jgi:hypothetical protein